MHQSESGLVSCWYSVQFLCSAEIPRLSYECQTSSQKQQAWRIVTVFFMVQLSHPYMTTGKTIALIIWTFVGKVICLLFKTLSRFDIAILPKSKRLLILWLQSPSTLTLEPKQMKSGTVSTFSPPICCEVIGLDAMILVFECWVLSQLFTLPFPWTYSYYNCLCYSWISLLTPFTLVLHF